MKKFLLGIVALFVGFIGFSSSDNISLESFVGNYVNIPSNSSYNVLSGYNCFRISSTTCAVNNRLQLDLSGFDSYFFNNSSLVGDMTCGLTTDMSFKNNYTSYCGLYFYSIPSSSSSDISVFYNGYNNVQSFICDGDTSIYLDGNFTFTQSNNLFTPYFNVHYIDGDSQVVTGQYDKSELYLQGQYNKTYTGGSNNYWVFDYIESPNINISSYSPVFDVEFTGEVLEDTGNVFNNFAENSLKFTLSNVPNYIQYVIIIMLLFFILGFIRKFRRK